MVAPRLVFIDGFIDGVDDNRQIGRCNVVVANIAADDLGQSDLQVRNV
jgi:hypothetical protein